jgi:signal transduction histidine kinase
MDIFSLFKVVLVLFVAFLNLALTVLVVNGPKNSVNRVFAAICFFFFLWCIALSLYEFPLILNSLVWIKITYLMALLYFVFNQRFSAIFPISISKNVQIVGNLISAAYFIFSFWLLFLTKSWVIDVVNIPGRHHTVLDFWGYTIWIIVTWVMILLPAVFFILKYKRANNLQKLQMGYYALGFILFGIAVTVFDGILPLLFNDTSYFFVSTSSNLFFSLIVAYIILRHRFLDVRFVILKVSFYSFFIVFLGIFYSLVLTMLAALFLGGGITTARIIFAGFVGFLTIISFFIFQSIFKRISEAIFYRDRYNPQVLIAKIGKIVTSTIELSEVSEGIIKEFLKQIKITAGVLIICDGGTASRIRQIGEMENPSIHGQALSKLIERIVIAPGENVLVADEMLQSPEKTLMEESRYSIILPLTVHKEIIGAIILSNKVSGQVYSTEDVNILKLLAPQIAIAVKNSLSYEQTKDLNLLLQVKVEKATEDLRMANEKLKDLDKLKDEFVSIVSHELRTPITVIKNYVWRILNDKTQGELTPKNTERLQSIYDSTEREITLISDILNVSRIEAGTMKFSPIVFDVAKLSRDVTEELKNSFTERKITLTVKKGSYKVKADKDNIRQVLSNLLTNAFKFTDIGGKITVSFQTKGKFVEASVSDTGIGIRKEDFSKLFTKFGKLDSAFSNNYQTAGTGLGLYLCKKLVEKQGGEIGVESAVGKGSKFIFNLKKAA